MITKDKAPPSSLLALGFLVLGLGLGWLAARSGGSDPPVPAAPAPLLWLEGPAQRPASGNGLQTLQLTVAPQHVEVLQRARDRAMKDGVLVQRPEEQVPATVAVDGRALPARIRLKGDWTDHLDTDKWSVRIEPRDGTHFGMTRFSIQHPKTRRYLREWLMLEAARHEGLLAPRVLFVNVDINGNPFGVHYLEEHFTKELLESQGRRDGPIVRFNEDTMWSVVRQHRDGLEVPAAPLVMGMAALSAEIDAFDGNRLARVDGLNERAARAIAQMRDLQRLVLVRGESPGTELPSALRAMEALCELQGTAVDELFAAPQMGRMLALVSLFRASHGIVWHNLRFYHDPVLDRLEPVLFDAMPQLTGGVAELLVWNPSVREFIESDACYEEAFRALGRMAQRDHVDGLLAKVGGDMERYAAALAAEDLLPGGDGPRDLADALHHCADEVRRMIAPDDPANFACRLLGQTLEVEAWATCLVPVAVSAFRFGNGRVVPAAGALDNRRQRYRRAGGDVVLPRDGRHLTFRFPVDARLASLGDVRQIKHAIREQTQKDEHVAVRLEVIHRVVGQAEATGERLYIRRGGEADVGGRPEPPTLAVALERHPCLGYDLDEERLFLRPGEWDVEGDLLVPRGHMLHADADVRLRFAPGATLVSQAPVRLVGHPERPVVLEAREPSAGWGGMIVLDTEVRSRMDNVVVRHAEAIHRGGWQTTGGVTFWGASVDLVRTRIEDARGEDALNIYGADFSMQDVVFQGSASDLFDGDIVTGTIRGSTFLDSVGDAIDVSGSRISVAGCRFRAIGDKCLSAGEASNVELCDSIVESATIAVAAKDLSEVRIDDLDVHDVAHYALAAFVKKPVYGPGSIAAHNVRVGRAGLGRYLVQKGCQVQVDGEVVPDADIDVKELYRRGVLGN